MKMARRINGTVEMVMVAVIRGYQIVLGPFLGGQCRYQPTCSVYGLEAVRRFGPWAGGWLAVKRIGRCHPFVKGGYDPVPERGGWLKGRDEKSSDVLWHGHPARVSGASAPLETTGKMPVPLSVKGNDDR